MQTQQNTLKEKYLSSYFLIYFNFIKNDKIVASYLNFLNSFLNSNDIEENIKKYSEFIQNLKNETLSEHIKKIISENKKINGSIDSVNKELAIINSLFSIPFDFFKQGFLEKYKSMENFFNNLPEFKTSTISLDYNELTTFENTNSKNIFSKNRAFIFDNDLEFKPINTLSTLSFKDLKGYKQQKEILYANTKALLNNQKVNNILLYGDAGCGKSSSVRALLNEFPEIIMIQIFKDNLINLDKLYQKLYDMPFKFIIFADDISFSDTDGTFSTMKAILEGSLIECPKNAAIYATSNRRHLVKESFQSRMGDEIHLNDTMNEINSLSERFGINLLFQRPSNDEFIDIVKQLAQDNNIYQDEKTLVEKAQKLALIKGSRSPRIAKQLIDNILAGVEI